MKELSIEEKAKAYDSIFERLKEMYSNNKTNVAARLIYERYFPELKESEDERIKKEIINYINFAESNNLLRIDDYEKKKGWIAWLEKQSTPQVRTGLEWVNTIDDACDKRYAEEYAHGEYCHEQSFKWGFQEGVDWLEKQGEPTDINPSEFDLRLNKLLKQFETLPKEELASSLSFYLNVVQNDGTYREEKQGEQKPNKVEPIEWSGKINSRNAKGVLKEMLDKKLKSADKVEPKFKVGDWVVKGDTIAQILDIQEQYYVGLDINGKDFTSSRFLNDDKIHLWTLQDAKDGDVLVSKYNQPFIYNGNRDFFHVGSYCGLSTSDKFIVSTSKCFWTENVSIRPATKEQRKLLFKEMKEAGYEWDSEHKQLKKIETMDKYEGLTDFERTLTDICIGWIGEEIGWKQYIKDNADILLKIAVEKFNSVQDATFEQKPTDEEMEEILHTEYEKGKADAIAEIQNHAWSEEDEEFLRRAINVTKDAYPMTAKWLKSLKSRVQPKQEWSEEDNQYLCGLIGLIEQSKAELPITLKGKAADNCIDWLKSLRPQNKWKPSDVQMKALNDLNLTGNISYAGQGQVLIKLYNDLKKL